jgi:hypothetical protein
MSFEKRLLDREDTDLPDGVKVFDSKQWPEDVGSHVTYGEAVIRKLSQIFCLSYRKTFVGFRNSSKRKKIQTLFPLNSFIHKKSRTKIAVHARIIKFYRKIKTTTTNNY